MLCLQRRGKGKLSSFLFNILPLFCPIFYLLILNIVKQFYNNSSIRHIKVEFETDNCGQLDC